MSCSEIFYVALPALHAIGALLAMGLSFGCDTGRAEQTARRPYALPSGLPVTTSFNTAFPWDEGFEFENHTWNPFALIFVFEWLTAGFALRPLQYYFDHTRLAQVWLVWISAGHLVFIAWTFTNSGGICPTMLAIVTASFFMSGVVCVYTLYYPNALDEQGDETAASEAKLLMRGADENYRDKDGRVWKIPRSITMLRRRFVGNDEEQDPQGNEGEVYQAEAIEEYEDIQGVIFRYAEYCITAPLLFLAVLCLMVVEAPAWLFLTGYWLLVTCNAIGIALHASFVFSTSEEKPEGGGLAPFVFKFFFAGPWRDPAIHQSSLLQAAWLCLLAPMGGLIFLTKDVLFSTDMPVLVLLLIWNLLLTYSLFGIVPTFVYMTHLGSRQLARLLDVLNVLAKFPLPLIILSGFITRPATNKFCF